MKQQFSHSLYNAYTGLQYFFLHERNGQIQLAIATASISLGIWFSVSVTEWLAIIFCIGSVISLEIMNTALEKLSNMVHAQYHPTIKIIKDVAAGAVLFASLISIVIACIVFIPKILN